MSWGGKREGAGRKPGKQKEISEMRPQRQLRAHDDEWQLIKKFAELVKRGEIEKCKKFISAFEG